MAQRGLVVSSQAAIERAAKSVNKAQERACEALQTPLLPRQAKRFETPDAAQAALAALRQSGRSHQGATTDRIEHKGYAGQGRPPPRSQVKSMAWQMPAQSRVDAAILEADTPHRACYVIGTNIAASQWSDGEILRAYQSPSHAASGCRFLTDPLCFVSSLFVKKPSRIQGVLMVMTLALLGYSVTQRR